MLLPLVRHVVRLELSPHNIRRQGSLGSCARDALPHTFNIGVIKSDKTNSSTIKHIYNEFASTIEGYNVAFDTNDGISHKRCQYGEMRSPSFHTRFPIGLSPCVPDKSSRGLGSMCRYSAEILICFIAYIFHFLLFLCGFG